MNDYAEVIAIVEGPTEQLFISNLLAPYLADRQVYLTPIILDKPGEKGGDVRFARAQHDIGNQLKQRPDTWVTLMVDYYGIGRDWPGYDISKAKREPAEKARCMNEATARRVAEMLPKLNISRRFIPYVSMHETESLYFSDPPAIAARLEVNQSTIDAILKECHEPERINDNRLTAPSKRLEKLSDRFKKTSTGIAIAKDVGIPRMRDACPLFNAWVSRLESLVGGADGEE